LTSEAATRTASRTEHVDSNVGPTLGPLSGRSELVIEVAPHNCFACGSLNEHGLHLDLHVDGDRCWTETELAERFQGWDGIAHGGIVATLLDEAMAWSLAATDNWGVTARMSIAFRKPIPIGTRIRAEGWMTERRRRVIDTAARIVDAASGDVLASGDATYVAADDERKAQLQARYRFRLIADPAAERGPGA
jgi:acyl-coenzyme A thioesterase PaaI-like protein